VPAAADAALLLVARTTAEQGRVHAVEVHVLHIPPTRTVLRSCVGLVSTAMRLALF